MTLFLELVEVDKIDYYGVPYKTKVLGHPGRNYGAMWAEFVQTTERSNKDKEEAGVYQAGQHGSISRSFVERGVNKDIEESFG